MASESICGIKKVLYDEGSIQWGIARKFQESRKKVCKFILANLGVCPFLCAVILLSIWSELHYPKLKSIPAILSLFNHINPNLLMSAVILWIVYHFAEISLLLAMTMGNLRYCRLYILTIAPILEISTLVYFIIIMWSVFNPRSSGENLSSFIVVTGSAITITALFFNTYLQALSQYVLRFNKYIMTLKYWPTTETV